MTHVEDELMQTVAFHLFPEDEQADFRHSCRRWRKDPDEFLVKAEQAEVSPGLPAPIHRDVIVVHIASGKGRRYSAGNGSNWNFQFEDDLQAVYFTR